MAPLRQAQDEGAGTVSPPRSIRDMVEGRDAPRVAVSSKIMADLEPRECRFPVGGSGLTTFFCAAEIHPGAWLPGLPGGSYCAFHRDFLKEGAAG